MNVLAMYVVHEMLQSEREQAAERHFALQAPAGPSLGDRIASAVAGLRRLLGSPTPAGPLPKLEDYPYRS